MSGVPCRVAGHKQIGRCNVADADMSSTCRSRRSTKSIPGILLPRSCLAQSAAVQAAQRGRCRQTQRVRQQGGEAGEAGKQCGAMQRLIGCSLWTHAANSNAIAAQQSRLQLKLHRLPRALRRFVADGSGGGGVHELATPPHNATQAQAQAESRARADTHSALEIGKLFSLLDRVSRTAAAG